MVVGIGLILETNKLYLIPFGAIDIPQESEHVIAR